MIVYADASSLVKRYARETGSDDVIRLTSDPRAVVGTIVITRAEVSAALGKAVRLQMLSADAGRHALSAFRDQWPDLVRLRVTEAMVDRADRLAWKHALRGYDAVHLAAAHVWREALDTPIVLATHDSQLWRSGRESGLEVWPDALDG